MICPICYRETENRHRPFCSKRCADIDLGRWLKGEYAIPANSQEDLEEETGGTDLGANFRQTAMDRKRRLA